MSVLSTDDLRRKARLILSQVQGVEEMYRLSDRALVAEYIKKVKEPEARPTADTADSVVVNEQVVLLKALHAQAMPSQETEFVKILSAEMNAANASVIVHALI